MLVKCLNLKCSAISASFGHALLAPALQTAGQIELDGNSIRFALLNRFAYRVSECVGFNVPLDT